ncbi:MAG TPA: hypothetical protein VKI19_08650 [Acidimicrobiales bacterium]|nr:hypothetical protein [Acidimicrobiales bacterium]
MDQPHHEPRREPAAESEVDGSDLLAFLFDFRSARDAPATADVVAAVAEPGSRFHIVPRQEWTGDPYQGSDAQEGPDWWQASDGRWYPPEVHPDRQPVAEPEPEPAPVTAEESQARRRSRFGRK